jgi:hypothetical protein
MQTNEATRQQRTRREHWLAGSFASLATASHETAAVIITLDRGRCRAASALLRVRRMILGLQAAAAVVGPTAEGAWARRGRRRWRGSRRGGPTIRTAIAEWAGGAMAGRTPWLYPAIGAIEAGKDARRGRHHERPDE